MKPSIVFKHCIVEQYFKFDNRGNLKWDHSCMVWWSGLELIYSEVWLSNTTCRPWKWWKRLRWNCPYFSNIFGLYSVICKAWWHTNIMYCITNTEFVYMSLNVSSCMHVLSQRTHLHNLTHWSHLCSYTHMFLHPESLHSDKSCYSAPWP